MNAGFLEATPDRGSGSGPRYFLIKNPDRWDALLLLIADLTGTPKWHLDVVATDPRTTRKSIGVAGASDARVQPQRQCRHFDHGSLTDGLLRDSTTCHPCGMERLIS